MAAERQLGVRVFVSGMALAAFGCFAIALSHWQSTETVKFACYLVAALLASPLKVSLPGIEGTLSVNFLFTLVGIVEMSLPETLLIGLAGTLAQFYWRPAKKLKPIQLIFNLSQVTVCSAAAYGAYKLVAIHILHAPGPLALLIAAVTHFAVNTSAMSTIIGLSENKPFSKVWTGSYLWSFAYYMVGAAIAGLVSFLNRHIGWQSSLLILPPIYLMYRSYRLYLGKLEAEKQHVEKVSNLHLRTIEALALAIEAKDETTGAHLQRVRVYAMELAKDLGLTEDETEALRAASVLHDIGKLAVPEHIISKPGKLTPEEFEKMKIHPIVGAEILEHVDFPYPVVPIVRAHHEKWDGSGYPAGLKGEEIPIGARILSAVDCLDALASDRQYRRAMPLDHAMAKVVAESGKGFDPRVVEILNRRYVELEKMAKQEPLQAPPKLSTDIKVERGLAPGAGFAEPETAPANSPEVARDTIDCIASAREEAQVLFELGHDFGASLSLDDMLSVLGARLKRLVPYDSMVVYMPNDRVLTARFVSGENSAVLSSLKIPLGKGLSGWVAENNKTIMNGNPSVEPGYVNPAAKHSNLESALAVPLVGISGVVAVLALYRATQNAFTRDHLRIVQALASRLGFVIGNAAKAQLKPVAPTTDPVTGLPNPRALFLHLDGEIARCTRSGEALAVLVTDFEGFKQLNEKFGHAQGDKLLQMFAAAIKECCRKYDYAARTGNDEFAIVLPGLDRKAAGELAQRLQALAAQSGQAIYGEAGVSLTIGEAFYPADGASAEQLLAFCDQSLFRAKYALRNTSAGKF